MTITDSNHTYLDQQILMIWEGSQPTPEEVEQYNTENDLDYVPDWYVRADYIGKV